MEPSDYFVAKSDKFTLIRKIGSRNLPLVSDSQTETIREIYRKICDDKYTSERELFEDIFSHYSGKSIITHVKNVD